MQNKINAIISNIPNIAHDDVPIGKDEQSNKIVKKNGKIRGFDFEIKSHVEIGEINKQIDFKNYVKLYGSRFVILNSNYSLLEGDLLKFNYMRN